VEIGIHPDQRAKIPHLVNQLEFLADAVEDAVEGAYKELPLQPKTPGSRKSVFALLYAHKKNGDHSGKHPGPGPGGDSSVVPSRRLFRMKRLCNFTPWCAGESGGRKSPAKPSKWQPRT